MNLIFLDLKKLYDLTFISWKKMQAHSNYWTWFRSFLKNSQKAWEINWWQQSRRIELKFLDTGGSIREIAPMNQCPLIVEIKRKPNSKLQTLLYNLKLSSLWM